MVPVTVPRQNGDAVIVAHDEGVRGETTIESLAGLRPAFDRNGHRVARRSAPGVRPQRPYHRRQCQQISDGASVTIITTAAVAERLGVTPLAETVGYGHVAGPDASLLHQPSKAIKDALKRTGMAVTDLDLFEINEAFAAVGVASADDLGISMDIVNVNGGAIALGHPLGMSGNRIALHLALELGRRGGGTGAAALCGGGG
jgi:acetyl-CoA C-acetyltransferase